MKKEQLQELKEKGYTILRNQIDEKWLNLLTEEVVRAFVEHRNVQLANGNDINTDGVALHVLLSSPLFIEFFLYIAFLA